ncbi:uncharacterized protein J4E87_004030 [Alternaria ethzedia]|uniref:uncharacterized protein n=1 Tax=Alternaria ethzedia TaxID=181014 RepID=UPI0020C5AA18|nr:uncharacterized protein J4E87_004030 [Alternaria ethzedia]KAI4627467.1 hypothetical protein J4E87_004030 [Alternaria ethzedia]
MSPGGSGSIRVGDRADRRGPVGITRRGAAGVELRELSEAESIEEVSTSELDSLLEDAEAVEEEGKVVYSVSLYMDELDTSGVSELVELTDVTGESEEDVSEGVTVGTGVSIVPESLVNDSDGVSEGKTKLLVPEVTDSVYETSSESLSVVGAGVGKVMTPDDVGVEESEVVSIELNEMLNEYGNEDVAESVSEALGTLLVSYVEDAVYDGVYEANEEESEEVPVSVADDDSSELVGVYEEPSVDEDLDMVSVLDQVRVEERLRETLDFLDHVEVEVEDDV